MTCPGRRAATLFSLERMCASSAIRVKIFYSSFSDGVTNSSGLDTAGLANKNSPLDPASNGFPAVATAFDNSYDYSTVALLGIVSQLDAAYNYDKTGKALPLNSPVKRRWGADEYEFYFQDSYKIKPTLTLTYGLRYSLFSPPWETTGTQVAPSFSLGSWFQTRANEMNNGIGSNQDPLITLDLAGPANGKPGFYKLGQEGLWSASGPCLGSQFFFRSPERYLRGKRSNRYSRRLWCGLRSRRSGLA